jgi:hypothetical protein
VWDGAKELELGEEVFNRMASFVKFLVVFALSLAVGLGRDHSTFARSLPRNQDPLVGVETLVGERKVSVQLRQQSIGPLQIAGFSAASEMKFKGIPDYAPRENRRTLPPWQHPFDPLPWIVPEAVTIYTHIEKLRDHAAPASIQFDDRPSFCTQKRGREWLLF